MILTTLIFRAITPELAPPQPEVLRNVAMGSVNLQNIEFRGTYPSAPSRLPMIGITYTDVQEELLQNIFTAFSISNLEVAEDVWSGDQYQVAVAETPTVLVLSRKDSATENSIPEEINTQFAVQEATKIIEGLYSFGPKPQVLLDQVELLGVDAPSPDGQKSNTIFIRVPFIFLVEEVPVYPAQDVYPAASIVLTSSYELYKAEFRPYTIETSIDKSYSTIAPNEAVSRINNNQGSILTYFYEGPNHADFSQINSGTLTEIDLQYRFDPTTNTAAPYYSFTGVIKNSAGYDIETTIITPALKTDFSDIE